MMKYLIGHKTYILGALGLLTVGLYFFGIIDLDTANMLVGLFGFGGMITLRSAIGKR